MRGQPGRVAGHLGQPLLDLLLHAGDAGRDGHPDDVRGRAGRAGGDVLGQPHDLRGEHGQRGQHPAQGLDPVHDLGLARALEHEARQLLPAEADLDAGARHRRPGQLGRHEVVERAVQVRDVGVQQHPGHGVVLGRQHRAHALGVLARGPGREAREERQLPRALRGVPGALRVHGQTPAADRRSATRSVRSQVNSGSERPKCPCAAVRA